MYTLASNMNEHLLLDILAKNFIKAFDLNLEDEKKS